MIIRSVRLRPIPSFLLPFSQSMTPVLSTPVRNVHSSKYQPPPVQPQPIPLIPDITTFLTVIGRNTVKYAANIPSWKALFTASSEQLREYGIEEASDRRYIQDWKERYRRGRFGIGGDFEHVENGVGVLRIVQVPAKYTDEGAATTTQSPGKKKIVVNLPADVKAADLSESQLVQLQAVKGIRIQGGNTIVGPHVVPMKGAKTSKIVVKEGLWEYRIGRKIDGGERRQAEVRAMRRAEERKAAAAAAR